MVPSVILPAANAPAPRRLEFEDVVPVEVGGFKGQTWDRGRSEPALHTTSNPFHGKKKSITTLIIRIKQNWSKNRGIPQQIHDFGSCSPGTKAPPCQGIPAAFHADTLVAAWPERRPRATADVASPGTPATGLGRSFLMCFKPSK